MTTRAQKMNLIEDWIVTSMADTVGGESVQSLLDVFESEHDINVMYERAKTYFERTPK